MTVPVLRDRWSRETIRSLRRRLRNVKRELVIQARARAKRSDDIVTLRRQSAKLTYENRMLTAALAKSAMEVERLREQIMGVADLADHPHEQTTMKDIAWMLRWHVARLVYPMGPPPREDGNAQGDDRGKPGE